MTDLKNEIIQAVSSAQHTPTQKVDLYSNPDVNGSEFKNELLFFMKPELTKASDTIKLDNVVDLILDKMSKFDVHIKQAQLLGADYLDQYNVMASHYGVINQVSKSPQNTLSDAAKLKFEEYYNVSITDPNVLGSFEFLNKYPEISSDKLDEIWLSGELNKFAGGTYAAKVKYNQQDVYLFNGFHPKQLEHFTQPGRSIVAFQVFSNTDWDVLRNEFIGATNPQKANAGSLRSEFLQSKDELGLEDVSQGNNGVHLSAGPVEGLVELSRFFENSDQSPDTLQKFNLGKDLLENFDDQTVESILDNSKIKYEETLTTVFDLTEEKNTDTVVPLISRSTFEI